jgi:hypothetical protein
MWEQERKSYSPNKFRGGGGEKEKERVLSIEQGRKRKRCKQREREFKRLKKRGINNVGKNIKSGDN